MESDHHDSQKFDTAIQKGEDVLLNLANDDPRRWEILNMLGEVYYARFHISKKLMDLQRSIQMLGDLVDSTFTNDVRRVSLLSKLSLRWGELYDENSDIQALRESIDSGQRAIDIISPGHDTYGAITYVIATRQYEMFKRTDEIVYVRRSITLAEKSMAQAPPNDPNLLPRMTDLALKFRLIADRTDQLGDISNAICAEEAWLSKAAEDNLSRYAWLDSLSRHCMLLFEKTGEQYHLDKCVTAAEQSTTVLPDNHDRKAAQLLGYSVRLRDRYTVTGNVQDLEKALVIIEQALKLISVNHEYWTSLMNMRSLCSVSLYDRDGELTHLNDSISAARGALGRSPVGDKDHIKWANNLANRLKDRFHHLGNIGDLDESISLLKTAVAGSHEQPEKLVAMINLSSKCLARFRCTQQQHDFCMAIANICQAGAYDAALVRSEYHNELLFTAAEICEDLYVQTDRIQHLEAAMNKCEELIISVSKGCLRNSEYLARLVDVLILFYRRTGSSSHLDRAISLSIQEIIKLEKTGMAKSQLVQWLGRWSDCYDAKYCQTGESGDLAESISKAEKAVSICSPEAAIYEGADIKLLFLLVKRFQLLGESKDIHRATFIATKAVSGIPDECAYKAAWLHNLSLILWNRYEYSRESEYSRQALRRAHEALEMMRANNYDQAATLDALGTFYHDLFQSTKLPNRLRTACYYARKAVDTTQKGDQFRPIRLMNKAYLHLECWKTFKTKGEVESAFSCGIEALNSLLQGSSHRASILNTLSLIFREHFESEGVVESLQKAICHSEEALKQVDTNGLSRTQREYNTAVLYRLRYDQSHNAADLQKSLDLYRQVACCPEAAPYLKIDASTSRARVLLREKQLEEAAICFEDAVNLMPYASPHSMSRTDQSLLLLEYKGVAVAACSLALNISQSPDTSEKALRLLEIGRGVIFGYEMQARRDQSELLVKHPELLERFNNLQDAVSHPDHSDRILTGFGLSSKKPLQYPQASHHSIFEKLENVIQNIRDQQGFESFGKPLPSKKYVALAAKGPVIVVICTTIRSDAIIIQQNAIRCMTLEKLRYSDAESKLESFYKCMEDGLDVDASKILLWLWKSCVKPILDSLEPIGNQCTVWWMGVGVMARAPFHAAGNHRSKSTSSTIARVVSSYTTTLEALHFARARSTRSAGNHQPSAIIVSMPSTHGLDDLPGVEKEVKLSQEILRANMDVTVSVHPEAKEILRQLPKQDIVHFACHGKVETLAFRSCVILDKSPRADRLTVHDISMRRTEYGRLAYLSACQTAETHTKSVDEPLHLASAFQVAGFPHTIGTLWPADDQACQYVTKSFYTTLFMENDSEKRYDLSANALHNAVVEIRERYPDNPSYWAPFVHFGA